MLRSVLRQEFAHEEARSDPRLSDPSHHRLNGLQSRRKRGYDFGTAAFDRCLRCTQRPDMVAGMSSAVSTTGSAWPAAVLFDFDGVIVNSEPVHFAAFKKLLGDEQIRLDEQEYYAELIGFDDRGALRHML